MSTNHNLAALTPDATLDEINSADHKAGQLLASIGLEPKNHKKETLRTICQQRKWSEVEVLNWIKKNRSLKINNSDKKDVPKNLDNEDSLTQWCNHIEKDYHHKILNLIGEISSSFPRVHSIHGNQYIWLKNVQWHLETFENKLQYYIYFEKKKFFPLIDNLNDTNNHLLDGTIQKIKRAIDIIRQDQKEMLNLIATIERKTDGLKSPPLACSTLRILNSNLETLFSTLRTQFEKEHEFVIPLIQKELES